jgi:hypothetical protein
MDNIHMQTDDYIKLIGCGREFEKSVSVRRIEVISFLYQIACELDIACTHICYLTIYLN